MSYVRLEKVDGSVADRPAIVIESHDCLSVQWRADPPPHGRGMVQVAAWQMFTDDGQPITGRHEEAYPYACHCEENRTGAWFFRLPIWESA